RLYSDDPAGPGDDPEGEDLGAYSIQDPSIADPSLSPSPDGWSSFSDQGYDDWFEFANSNIELQEANFGTSGDLGNVPLTMEGVSIGTPFVPGGDQDLIFFW